MSKTLPSYTSGTSETPLLGMTIGEMLDRTAEKYPDTEAWCACTRTSAGPTKSSSEK